MKILIAGLGNPGNKFEHTRHNAGFLAVAKFQKANDFPAFQEEKKFQALLAKKQIDGKEIILALPQTFMNLSGEAIKKISAYYKIAPADIIIIHDDLDISLGKYKIARDRSSAGHKGVQSIIEALGTKDFSRIRIGIDIENKKIPTEAFVLENFSKEEQKIIDEVVEKVCEEIEFLIKKLT